MAHLPQGFQGICASHCPNVRATARDGRVESGERSRASGRSWTARARRTGRRSACPFGDRANRQMAPTPGLLLGMLLVVGVIRRAGAVEYLAIYPAKLARGRPRALLALLGARVGT